MYTHNHPHSSRPTGRRQIAAFVGAIALLVTLVESAVAAPPPAISGFVGQWVTADCATTPDGVVDCGLWGDGSTMSLTIGTGEYPQVTIRDSFAIGCQVEGNPATRFTASGVGTYDGDHLWVDFSRGGCGRFRPAVFTIQLYHDPGSDTLWEDEDGDEFGYIWYRAPSATP
jgi:hypothetical protein